MAVPSAVAKTQGTTVNITTGGTTDEIGEIQSIRGLGGGNATVISTTHLKSLAEEKAMGLSNEGQAVMEGNCVPSDAGQRRAFAAKESQLKQTFAIIMTDNPTTTLTFEGFVLGYEIGIDGNSVYKFTMPVEVTGALAGFPPPA